MEGGKRRKKEKDRWKKKLGEVRRVTKKGRKQKDGEKNSLLR